MSLPTYLKDSKAVRISLYYEGSQTVREGMPLCYNNDTTTNWTSVDRNSTAGTYDTDTPEGSQNEGKFIRVEDPAATNLMWFAGVVAEGSPGIGAAGPSVVDVFVPNGAIVPVRSSLSSTVGRTVFAIRPAVYTLTQPTYGGSTTACVPVGIAEETVDRSSTNGLCLARLDRDMFLSQGYGLTTNLLVGTGVTSGTLRLNSISFETAATGGYTEGLYIRAEALGAGSGALGLSVTTALINTSQAGICEAAAFFTTWKSGGTAGAHNFFVSEFKYENQDATPADISSATGHYNLRLLSNISATTAPAANTVAWIYCNAEGADKPDFLLKCEAATDVAAVAMSGDITWDSSDFRMPIRIGGTTYWILLSADAV